MKKFYTQDEAKKRINDVILGKVKIPVVNKKLEKKLKSIIEQLIAKEFRKEALDILLQTDSDMLGSFLYYYYSNIGNVACMVIDTAKDKLVKSGKMKQKTKDGFGRFMKDDKKKNPN